MKTKSTIITITALAAAVVATVACAGPLAGHPNLINARDSVNSAIDSIWAAKRANHNQLGGHANAALSLLTQAKEELVKAAETANDN